jgi:hypothetical protein
MQNLITYSIITWVVFNINLSALNSLIKSDKLNHPFWTRSVRCFLMFPPFAIIYMFVLAMIEVSIENINLIKQILVKRKN